MFAVPLDVSNYFHRPNRTCVAATTQKSRQKRDGDCHKPQRKCDPNEASPRSFPSYVVSLTCDREMSIFITDLRIAVNKLLTTALLMSDVSSNEDSPRGKTADPRRNDTFVNKTRFSFFFSEFRLSDENICEKSLRSLCQRCFFFFPLRKSLRFRLRKLHTFKSIDGST